MRTDRFQKLLSSLSSLTAEQLEKLNSAVSKRLHTSESYRVIEAAKTSGACPHCGSASTIKNGISRGLQRYLCHGCKKTFCATTGTPLARLRHKEKFIQQGQILADGLSVRAAARELGVSLGTALLWRHRFLEAVVAHQPRRVSGLLEADETYIRESQKGSRSMTRPPRARGDKDADPDHDDLVPVMVTRLRGYPYVSDKVMKAMNKDEAHGALKDVVAPDTLLCVDGHGAFRGLGKSLGIKVKAVAVTYDGRVKDGVYHVQSVNNYHERMKSWINNGLRGVSTKYLPNYLAWMRLREWFKDGLKPEHFVASALGRQLINT